MPGSGTTTNWVTCPLTVPPVKAAVSAAVERVTLSVGLKPVRESYALPSKVRAVPEPSPRTR